MAHEKVTNHSWTLAKSTLKTSRPTSHPLEGLKQKQVNRKPQILATRPKIRNSCPRAGAVGTDQPFWETVSKADHSMNTGHGKVLFAQLHCKARSHKSMWIQVWTRCTDKHPAESDQDLQGKQRGTAVLSTAGSFPHPVLCGLRLFWDKKSCNNSRDLASCWVSKP